MISNTTTDWTKSVLRENGRGVCSNAWNLLWQQREWTAATDGRLFVLAEGQTPGLTEAEGKNLTTLCTPLDVPRTPQGRLSGEALREWIGSPPSPCERCGATGKVECRDCHGTGSYPCPTCDQDVDCEECENGQASCPVCSRAWQEPGRLAGVLIDRANLSRVLCLLGDCTVSTASCGKSEPTPFVVLEGNTWLVLVVALSRTEETEIPELTCAPPLGLDLSEEVEG